MKFSSLLRNLSLLAILSAASARPKRDNDPEIDWENILGRVFDNSNSAANANTNTNNGNGNGSNNSFDKDADFLEARDDNEPVRLIFKYKNQRGRDEAMGLGQLNLDIPRLNLASISATQRILRLLELNPNIESVDVDYKVYTLGFPDHSSSFRNQYRKLADQERTPYGITLVQANDPGIPEIPDRETKMKVCVVDTGYDINHPDLPSDNVAGFTPSNIPIGQRWDDDNQGHGSHVAGTIGAIGGNLIGVDSVLSNPSKFEFFIGKGLSDSGSGYTSDIIQAVVACADNGGKVVNLSLGGGAPTGTALEAFRRIYINEGVLMVAAAGNSGDSTFGYPASFPEMISVASLEVNGNDRSSFSQYNSQVEISAPGRLVLSTLPADVNSALYAEYSGTSMASPHVAGVAALVWAHFPECSNFQIRNVLFKTALDKGTSGCDIYYGAGLVQARAAYDLLKAEGCAAGGSASGVISAGSLGGCSQNIDTMQLCNKARVTVDIITDYYPRETSFEMKDASGSVVSSGGGYLIRSNLYTTNMCLDNGVYTFTIFDSYGDGICCRYREGYYSIYVNGEKVKSGGSFGRSQSTVFTIDSSSPETSAPSVSMVPSTLPSSAPSKDPSAMPSGIPSSSPSSSPSKDPSAMPSGFPSSSPSSSPTETLSVSPTSTGTGAPSASSSPSSIPSSIPSKFPSSNPSSSPSNFPSSSPSQEPSSIPSTSPSKLPSSSPSREPSSIPSSSPSLLPSSSPTIAPSSEPSSTPSKSPTKVPSVSPTSQPSVSSAPTSAPVTSAPAPQQCTTWACWWRQWLG